MAKHAGLGRPTGTVGGGGVKEALLCDITVVVILGVEDVTDGD